MKRILVFLLYTLFLGCFCAYASAADSFDAEKRDLIYATEFSFSPYRIMINHEYGGFEIDITRAIFKNSAYKIHYRERIWNINDSSGTYDDANWDLIGWRVMDPIVRAKYIHSDPIFEYHWGAFTLPGVGAISLDNLKRHKVGIVGRKYPFAMLTQRGYIEKHDFTVYNSQERALQALMSGEIDVWIDERRAASSVLIKANLLSGTVYHEETEKVIPVGYAIRATPENLELKRFIDRRIKEIKADGQFEYFYKLYFGSESPELLREHERSNLLVFFCMLLVLLLLTALSTVLVFLLRKHARLSAELRLTVANLATSREQYQMAVEGADDGIIYYDETTGIPFLSPRCFAILGLDDEVERDLSTLLLAVVGLAVPEDHAQLLALLDNIKARTPVAFSSEIRIKRGDELRWILLRLKSHEDKGRLLLGGTVSDITMRKGHESVIVFYAECDPLTGIYNRRKMDSLGTEMVEACRKQQKSMSLVFMDLDNFKRINDTLGHQQGDLALKLFVNETKRLLPKDAIFGRMGGDEFIIMLPHKYRAAAVMQGILTSLNQLNEAPGPFSSSIGIAFYPQHGQTLDDLIRSADSASRLAKARGKDRIEVFSEEDI